MTILCNGYEPARPCPVECQSQLLLDEFREFRGEQQQENREIRELLAKLREDFAGRVTTLESHVKAGLTGNGQPSRMTSAETRLTALERSWWKLVGASGVLWALIEVALKVFPWGRH